MNRDDLIKMARDAGFEIHERKKQVRIGMDALIGIDSTEKLERFTKLVTAHEREAWPSLDPVIAWLENGCNPQDAAKELRLYSDAIRERGTK